MSTFISMIVLDDGRFTADHPRFIHGGPTVAKYDLSDRVWTPRSSYQAGKTRHRDHASNSYKRTFETQRNHVTWIGCFDETQSVHDVSPIQPIKSSCRKVGNGKDILGEIWLAETGSNPEVKYHMFLLSSNFVTCCKVTKYQGVKNFTLVARMQKIVALS